jgi:ATP-dependent DNA ligase
MASLKALATRSQAALSSSLIPARLRALRLLLLGAYDEAGELRYMGAMRTPKQGWGKAVSELLMKLSTEQSFATEPTPGRSRWESHRFDEWFPVAPKIVCEVAYSRLDGGFLRHGARFRQWRTEKEPVDCQIAFESLGEVWPLSPDVIYW